MADLIYKHHVAPQDAALTSLGMSNTQMIDAGRLALAVDGSWALSWMNSTTVTNATLGTGALPKMAQAGSNIQAHFHSALAAAKDPDAAWQWVRFLATPFYQSEFCKIGLWLPSQTSLTTEEGLATWITEGIHPANYTDLVTDYLPAHGITSRIPPGYTAAFTNFINPAFEAINNGQAAADVLPAAVQQANDAIAAESAALKYSPDCRRQRANHAVGPLLPPPDRGANQGAGSIVATQSEATPFPPNAGRPRGPRLSMAQRRNLTGYLFVSPFMLGFLIWFLIPAGIAVYLATQRWDLITAPEFVGIANLQRLTTDPLLPQSLRATFLYTVISVPLGLAFSFFLAMLISKQIPGISIFRTIYYLPSIVPAVASATLWAWIFNTEFGLLNALLRDLGASKLPWLQDPAYALPSFIFMSLWGGAGGAMIIFLAGLQGIPDVYYEAAEIDGAGGWAKTAPPSPCLADVAVIFSNLVIGFSILPRFPQRLSVPNGGPENSTLFWCVHLRTAFRA